MSTGPISLRQDWQHTDGKAHMRLVDSYDAIEGVTKIAMQVWDTNLLAWVRYTPGAGGGGAGTADSTAANQVTEIARLTTLVGQLPAALDASGGLKVAIVAGGSSGGGGGAVTVGDGADIAQGTTTDVEAAAGNGSVIALLKRLRTLLASTLSVNTGLSQPLTDAQLRANPVPVSNASLPLPTGASTSANQASEVASLASLDTKLPAQGQALAANSTPVVLPAAQIAAITPPAAISGFALEAGHLAAIDATLALIKAKTDNVDVLLSTRTKPADSQHVTVDGTVTVSDGLVQALTDTQLRATPVPVTNTALPLPANAAQETGGNLATIASEIAQLTPAQGAVGTSLLGPMVQALANDTPPFRIAGNVYPLSMTADGRLRVAAAMSIADTDFWANPFGESLLADTLHFTAPGVTFF